MGTQRRSFYEYVMTFRGKLTTDDESKLAEWIFQDHAFPRHSKNYYEVSDYLEWNSPFVNALTVFDKLWEKYEIED